MEQYGDAFVLARCEEFLAAEDRKDTAKMREIFFRVACRCAQHSIWLDHQRGEPTPAEDNLVWEDLAYARGAVSASC